MAAPTTSKAGDATWSLMFGYEFQARSHPACCAVQIAVDVMVNLANPILCALSTAELPLTTVFVEMSSKTAII